jgi:hypothetical protein
MSEETTGANESTPKEEYQQERQMSKAASLAMELSKEKARLQRELEDMQQQFEVVAPSTPTGGPDSYLKWVGVIFAVIGIFLQSGGFTLYGQLCYLLGATSWTVVGIYWNDKAVMLGSVIPATATALAISRTVFGG